MQELADSVVEFIDRFANGPDRLESVIGGLPDKELDLALGNGDWTIRQYIPHIVDGDDYQSRSTAH